MKTSNKVSYHFLKTRSIQRKVTTMLKAKGINAASKGTKQPEGWQTTIKGVILSKPVKSVVFSASGRAINVLTK